MHTKNTLPQTTVRLSAEIESGLKKMHQKKQLQTPTKHVDQFMAAVAHQTLVRKHTSARPT